MSRLGKSIERERSSVLAKGREWGGWSGMGWGGVGEGEGTCGCQEWGAWRVLTGMKFLSGVINAKRSVLKLMLAIAAQF